MSKLFKSKGRLTPVNAARRLSVVLGTKVTAADLSRLGLVGRLQRSVTFVNKPRGSCAKPVGPDGVVNEVDAGLEKPLASRERRTLLVIIAALCSHSNIKYQERGAAVRLRELTEKIGARVSDDTTLRVLDQIPEALESRMK
jgi:hypothetical protein